MLQAKGNAIYVDTTTDLSAAIGKLVTFANGSPAVNTSTAVPAVGIVLDARTRTVFNTTRYDNAIGILGGLPGPVRAVISAASAPLNFGDLSSRLRMARSPKTLAPADPRVAVGVMTTSMARSPATNAKSPCSPRNSAAAPTKTEIKQANKENTYALRGRRGEPGQRMPGLHAHGLLDGLVERSQMAPRAPPARCAVAAPAWPIASSAARSTPLAR